MAATSSSFHLTIGSRFENIELVQTVLADCLERCGLGDDACHWVDLAVREAVANAIRHGNRLDRTKKVEVDLDLDTEQLTVTVRDEGEGFDPSRVEDPREPENLLRPNGRGIFYMERFMDVVEYRPRTGGGTELVLRKRLAAAGSTDTLETTEETR
jgi:serine/threonine-protein kinase RsbW